MNKQPLILKKLMTETGSNDDTYRYQRIFRLDERENKLLLADFIEKGGKTVVLPIVYETSHRFALIKDALKKKGTPIPLNDIWIAAQCMEKGAVLLSFDGHFEAVDGLLLWNLPG